MQISVIGNEQSFLIERNVFRRAFGKAIDPINFHLDCFQINAAYMAIDNTNPYRIIGNTFYPSGGRSLFQQAILIGNTPDSRAINVVIKHNVIMTKDGKGIHVERPSPSSIIHGNTVLLDQNPPAASTVPTIRTENAVTAQSGKMVSIKYNICPLIHICVRPTPTASATCSAVGNQFNKEYGNNSSNTNVTYAADLQGTNFDSAALTSVTAFRNALTPDTATTLVAANGIKIGALRGYYNYSTGAVTEPANYNS